MKTLIAIFLFLPVFCLPQIYSKKDLQQLILPASCLFLSGAFDGTAETLKAHYSQFKHVFPAASNQFWNYSQSWTNKYKNGIPPQPAYFLSKSVLVGTTDGYHAMRTASNLLMITAVTIRLGEPRKWYKYLIDGAIMYIMYNAGFTLTYDLIF